MNFTSLSFLVFFPVVFVLHWLLPHRMRWVLLLAASWLFYFQWDIYAGLLLILTTVASWICASQLYRSRTAAGRYLWLGLALTVSLGCLFGFKYTGFFASLVGLRLSMQILLPVGISFYTFQTLSYVIDVYRGAVEPEAHFGYYALFIAFFPQLVAGPIERPERLLPQLRAERALSRQILSDGAWLLLRGYFKKIVIADYLAPIVDAVFAAPESVAGAEVIVAAVLFGFQIYCDFSGYTDIARGSAKLLGIDLAENFDRPYTAVSIRDFWHKWHMSLTSWFTDYVYIPLGGSRNGTARMLANIMIVFLLSGLWHGAAWHFVLWGALHGLFLCAETLLFRNREQNKTLSRVITFSLVSFAWIFFRADDLHTAAALLERLPLGWAALSLPAYAPRTVLAVLCLWLLGRIHKPAHLTVFLMLTALATAWLALLAGGGNNAFIYFQF